jgi:hypothetical protein
MRPVSYRALLELDDGSFVHTHDILLAPELQRRCKEKRTLNAIIRRLRKAGLLLELEPDSSLIECRCRREAGTSKS